jgi:PAS domain S-box-containing protein
MTAMNDTSKTKAQLIDELETLRERVAALEASQADATDVEEQRRVKIMLDVIEGMADGLILMDADGRFVFINRAIEKISGYKRDELLGRHYEEFVPRGTRAEEAERVDRTIKAALENGTTPPMEFTLVGKDGREVHIASTASLIMGDGGEPQGLVATYRDITDRTRMEASLRESEERFRALFEGSLDAICLVDPVSGKILNANPVSSELLSKPLEDIIGMHYSEFHSPPIRERAQESFEAHVEDEVHRQPIETTLLASDGKEVPAELLAQIIQVDGVPVLMGTFRDLTQRKHSEERYRLLAQNSPDIITIINPDQSFRYISAAAERILGYTPDEVIEHMGFDHVHPEDRAATVAEYSRLLESPGEQLNSRYRLRRKDGSYRFVEAVGNNVLANSAIRAIVLNIRDVTERVMLEEQLRSSEERYRLLVQNSSDMIALMDAEGKVHYISPTTKSMLGYEPEELLGQVGLAFHHPEDKAGMLAAGNRCLQNPDEPVLAQYRFRHKDGSWTWLESIANNCLDHPAIGAIVVNTRDITERKAMEDALEKTEQLESLSVLCGGIAHDFNNILTAVLTNISMAQMYGELEEDIEKMLADAEKASLRGKGLTQQLLTFAKGGEPIKRAVSITTLLKDTIAFALSGSNVRCERDLAEDLWPVDVDEGQIGQVIQNMILNADQAMPGGGTIQVRAENVRITEHDPLRLGPGNHVKVTIVDQGIGIPEEHLQKVFDPFFTTKQKGSGLGLSTSYSIVKRHNGALQVESRLGGGTKIHIYLPALPEGGAKRGTQRDASYRGEERVLLIDDDDTLRRSIGKALDQLGYEVAHAEDGKEGIKIYEEARASGRPIHVVVMDLTIPGGMGGKDAAREILQIDPDAKLIVSSGYSTDPVMSDFRAHGFRGVISKPYRIEDLGETLRRVLTKE